MAGTSQNQPVTRSGRVESVVLHIVGLALIIGGLGMVVSAAIDISDSATQALEILACGVGSLAIGFLFNRVSVVPERIDTSSVFAAVAFSWVALTLVSAVLYVVTGTFDSFADGVFESVSGFTTTGATVLDPIEGTAHGVLFWRSTTQWLGGMGVIVLVVAVLPVLGVGGMDLLAAEAPGPSDERLTPRVRFTAQRLWAIYVGFTLAIIGAYVIGGMSVFDAVNHAFTTISTGGFSTYDDSFAHFGSTYLEWAAVVSMFAAGASFPMYYRVLRGRSIRLFRSMEAGTYLGIVLVGTAIILIVNRVEVGVGHGAVRETLFTVVSISSTTGYGLLDFTQWAVAPQTLLLIMMAMGAMAGSTAGGFKVIRVLGIMRFARRELLRALHPELVRPVRVGRSILEERVVNRIMGFFVMFLGTILAATVTIAAFEVDLVTALSAAVSSIGNVGPGLGELGSGNYTNVDTGADMAAAATMLLGRLEIYPVLLAVAAFPRWRARWDAQNRVRRSARR